MIRWLFVVLVGCGRLGFDPLGDGSSSSGSRRPPSTFSLVTEQTGP
jgi:hypothetical protein